MGGDLHCMAASPSACCLAGSSLRGWHEHSHATWCWDVLFRMFPVAAALLACLTAFKPPSFPPCCLALIHAWPMHIINQPNTSGTLPPQAQQTGACTPWMWRVRAPAPAALRWFRAGQATWLVSCPLMPARAAAGQPQGQRMASFGSGTCDHHQVLPPLHRHPTQPSLGQHSSSSLQPAARHPRSLP